MLLENDFWGAGRKKTLFLNLFKKKEKKGGRGVLQFSSVIIVADMFQIISVTVMNVIFNKK